MKSEKKVRGLALTASVLALVMGCVYPTVFIKWIVPLYAVCVVLFAVAAATSELQLEIVSTNGRTDARANRVVVDFTIRLKDKAALDRLISKLKQDKRVLDVFRATST